jgi:hypothetical protein
MEKHTQIKQVGKHKKINCAEILRGGGFERGSSKETEQKSNIYLLFLSLNPSWRTHSERSFDTGPLA